MMSKVCGRLLLVFAAFLLALGCNSAEVEYPENPTPPPDAELGVAATPSAEPDE